VNVAYFGTSEFGADVLRALVERGAVRVAAVVSLGLVALCATSRRR